MSASIRCAACGRRYGAAEWSALARVRTLTSADVGAYVTDWPAERMVEVRACACGRALARTTTVEGRGRIGC